MNLPRHTLTSHGPEPVFVSAHFTRIASGDSSRPPGHGTTTLHDADAKSKQRKSDHILEHSRASSGQKSDAAVRYRDVQSSSPLSAATRSKDKGKEREKEQSRQPIDTSSHIASPSGSRLLLTCATRSGFFVAEAESSRIKARRDFTTRQGGLAHACVIDGTSLVALVGGGRVPRFAPNKVILWDEDAKRNVVTSPVRAADASAKSQDSDKASSPAPSVIFSISQEDSTDTESDSLGGLFEPEGEGPVASLDDADAPLHAKESLRDEGEDDVIASVILPGEEEETVPGSNSASEDQTSSPQLAPPAESETAKVAEALPKSKDGPDPSTRATDDAVDGAQNSPETGRVLKGSALAELEFGETVRGIKIDSFPLSSQLEEPDEGADASRGVDTVRVSVMLVKLRSHIVIFEIGRHLPNTVQSGSEWGILQRGVVEIHPNAADCDVATAYIADTNCVLIAMPGRQRGHVQMLCLSLSHTSRTSLGSSIGGSSSIIAAHSSAIGCIALSDDGQLLCTASERGTLLRLWSTQLSRRKDGAQRSSRLQSVLVAELRRGSSPATILGISIDPDKKLLAAASDRGTVHLFDLLDVQGRNKTTTTQRHDSSRAKEEQAKKTQADGVTHGIGAIPNALYGLTQKVPATVMPQLMRSQWSFAQYRIPLQVFSHRAAEGGPQFEGRAPPTTRHSRRGGDDAGIEADVASAIGEAIVPTPPQKLEGGWDIMRGRIDDIRRGEKTIEERMWLVWISGRSDEASGSGKTAYPFELVAITSSGSHYRLGVRVPASDDAQDDGSHDSSASVVLDMYRSDVKTKRTRESRTSPASTHAPEPGLRLAGRDGACWLIEHTRFGLRDPWVD